MVSWGAWGQSARKRGVAHRSGHTVISYDGPAFVRPTRTEPRSSDAADGSCAVRRRVAEGVLTRIARSVQRVTVGRLLQERTALHAVLAAALEEIPAPAFVLDRAGTVISASAVGTAWLASDPLRRRRSLRGAVRSTGAAKAPFRVTRIASAGTALRFLVVCKAADSIGHRCRTAAREWRFSPREAEVVALLGEGLSNRSIGAQLGVAQRTVETYFTSMFDKAQVESRAELIVKALRHSLL